LQDRVKGEMHQLIPREERCDICRRRVATTLCDMPRRSIGTTISGVPAAKTICCDRKLCDECRIHINEHFDLCPTCSRFIARKIKDNEMRNQMKGKNQ